MQRQGILVANRGEIAIRVIHAARELDYETIAVYAEGDEAHASFADRAVRLSSPGGYMNIEELIGIAQKEHANAIHPAYGFLSENQEFADCVTRAGIKFVGPSAKVIGLCGDKVRAKEIADKCQVPVIPSGQASTVADVEAFIKRNGLPVMLKAVDGGGGKGIRLVSENNNLQEAFNRSVGESPSKKVFVEAAIIEGARHIEVQIIADEHGNYVSLHERECTVQRRYQKVVEVAPSRVRQSHPALIEKLEEYALRIAKYVGYTSLGTFEFLVQPHLNKIYFLEVNPRLQVEHTITEEIMGIDLVKSQLLISQGNKLNDIGLRNEPPRSICMQLRLTAENPRKDFSLSMGKVTRASFPHGKGVRIETWLTDPPHQIMPFYDSLLAKIIVSGSTWADTLSKARRALRETSIEGIETNLSVLRGVVDHPAFDKDEIDTRWFERSIKDIIAIGEKASSRRIPKSAAVSTASSGMLFRPGDAFNLKLTPKAGQAQSHSMTISSISRNAFPSEFNAEVTVNSSPFTLSLTQATGATGSGRMADSSNPNHVPLVSSGMIVEVSVKKGDKVNTGDTLCVVSMMKMETVVRAPFAGRVVEVGSLKVGQLANEGALVCELEADKAKL